MNPIAQRLDSLFEEFESALGSNWRDRLTLVAVTKTVGPDEVRAAAGAGVVVFGENRVQELIRKVQALADLKVQWHMIGHLQTNKAKAAVECASMIESVDSVRLAQELDRRARPKGVTLPILLEVNVSGEASKSGLAAADLEPTLDELARLDARERLAVEVQGLMTMAPFTSDERVLRETFSGLRKLKEKLARRGDRFLALRHLSMGMTGDYRIAIEEGSTMVRLGTRIFGEG